MTSGHRRYTECSDEFRAFEETDLFKIQRTKIKAKDKLPNGRVKIEVGKFGQAGRAEAAVPLALTGNDCRDIGSNLSPSVSLDSIRSDAVCFHAKPRGTWSA